MKVVCLGRFSVEMKLRVGIEHTSASIDANQCILIKAYTDSSVRYENRRR